MLRLSFVVVLFMVCIGALSGCGGTALKATPSGAAVAHFSVTEISNGLPARGLWREAIALADMNDDGFLDIVAPPQRKANAKEKKPSIFLWDQKEGRWRDGNFTFPELKDYDYGGVAVGDINRDGFPDIVLATHSGRLIVLVNDMHNGFVTLDFPVKEEFHSRTIALTDINDDGWPDIISLSEAPVFYKGQTNPRQSGKQLPGPMRAPGILVGINRSGKDWEVQIVKESGGLFGDSLAIGAVTTAGNKDIVIAPLLSIKGQSSRALWRGDGKGNFSEYKTKILDDYLMYFTRTGDVDGDGRAEVAFVLSGFESDSSMMIKTFKWMNEGEFSDISQGLELIKEPKVFDFADIDGDGGDELAILASDGLHLCKYNGKVWIELGHHFIPYRAVGGAGDLRVGKQRDGSWLVVYNQGKERGEIDNGLKAYLLRWR